MATIFKQYLTKFIIQLLNEYGNCNSSDEKKIQRDTLTSYINKLASKEQELVNDKTYQENLLFVISKSRQEALSIATKTSGISSGEFEKFCDCATLLISELFKLFKDNNLDDINVSNLLSDLSKDENNHRVKFKLVYILSRRILLEYDITKLKSAALKSNGLDSFGYWKSYIKSFIPSINIDDKKATVLKDSIDELKKSVKYALERDITEEEMEGAFTTLSRQLRILLDDLRKTHGSKTPSIADSFSLYTIAYSISSMAITPGDGESENIVSFIKDELLPKICNKKEFNKIPKIELAAMFSCNYRIIRCYLKDPNITLTDGKQDIIITSASSANAIAPTVKKEEVKVEQINSAQSASNNDAIAPTVKKEEVKVEQINSAQSTSNKDDNDEEQTIDDNEDAMSSMQKPEKSVKVFSLSSEQKAPKPGSMF